MGFDNLSLPIGPISNLLLSVLIHLFRQKQNWIGFHYHNQYPQKKIPCSIHRTLIFISEILLSFQLLDLSFNPSILILGENIAIIFILKTVSNYITVILIFNHSQLVNWYQYFWYFGSCIWNYFGESLTEELGIQDGGINGPSLILIFMRVE